MVFYSLIRLYYITTLPLVDKMATFRTVKRWLQNTTGENITTRIVRRNLLKSALAAILTPLASRKYLFIVLDVAILLASVRCEKRQSCQGGKDHGQPRHGLSFTQPVSITFFIIPYIAPKPICTFLAIGQRL